MVSNPRYFSLDIADWFTTSHLVLLANETPPRFSGATVMPKGTLYLVVILLLGHVFGALQFGPLYRHPKLDRVVMTESHTLIDISAQGYGAMLQLEDAGLKVPSVYGMTILVIPKQGKMKTPDTNNVIKVRQDDIIIIYSGAKFQRNRYNSTSAENLKTLVEGDTSSFVFGVSIHNTHPRVLKGGVAPSNYGFVGYSIHNVDDYHGTALYSSSCQISTNKDVIRLSVLVSTKGIEVFMEKGGAGVLLRNGKVVERFDFDQRLIPFKSGDIVLVMLPANSKNNLPLDRAIALIKQGRRLFLGPTFPNVISFVATIVDNVPNYLEDAAVVGEGSVDCGIFYHHDEFRSTWWFEENTMNGVTALAEIIHVKEEEIKDNVDDLAARVGGIRMDDEAIEFKMNTFKFTHLKPRDIISIISGEEGVEEVSVSTIRRALSGCKTSADLKNALQKLKFHPSTTAMAAFVSDKVPPSKMKMANFITNETADANKTASWTKSDNEIKVSSPGGASGSASAAIMFRGRNRVAISQKGGAVALIINDKGLKHGDKVAFNNTLRKLKLEDGNGISNHANLEVEPGDVVMVLLPTGVGEYKLNPYEIGAIIMDDLDDSDGSFSMLFSDGVVAVIAARIERTE